MIRYMTARALAGIIVLICAAAADDLPAHILALAREQHSIADELRHLPDYTCTETIDRYTAESGRPLRFNDRIVVEIAIAGRRELYAWPGRRFEERSVIDMVGQGFISDGDFSTMLHNVFVGNAAQISYTGPESPGARRLLRYNFHIPVMSSGWHMSGRGRTGTMGSLGSFWLDAATLDLVRMRFDAEDMPAWSADQSLEEDVDYAPVTIGESRLLLPSYARITAVDFSSRTLQNRIAFTNCRKFSSESTISFTDSTITFDEDLRAQLASSLDTARAAKGDEIVAVTSDGEMLKGTIRNIDRRTVTIEWAVKADLTNIPIPARRAIIPAGSPLTLHRLPM